MINVKAATQNQIHVHGEYFSSVINYHTHLTSWTHSCYASNAQKIIYKTPKIK